MAEATPRNLLLAGALAGPLYLAATFIEILARPGFDPTRHSWSLLANGDLGWVHVANFLVAGVLTITGAAGLRRAGGVAGGTASVLLAIFGVSLVAAGLFPADPAFGFPPGTPEGPPASFSTAAGLHLLSGIVGFLCLIAACLLVARGASGHGQRGYAAFSGLTGVVFLGAFVGIAAGPASPAGVLGFTAGVVLAWCWLTASFARGLRSDPGAAARRRPASEA